MALIIHLKNKIKILACVWLVFGFIVAVLSFQSFLYHLRRGDFLDGAHFVFSLVIMVASIGSFCGKLYARILLLLAMVFLVIAGLDLILLLLLKTFSWAIFSVIIFFMVVSVYTIINLLHSFGKF